MVVKGSLVGGCYYEEWGSSVERKLTSSAGSI